MELIFSILFILVPFYTAPVKDGSSNFKRLVLAHWYSYRNETQKENCA